MPGQKLHGIGPFGSILSILPDKMGAPLLSMLTPKVAINKLVVSSNRRLCAGVNWRSVPKKDRLVLSVEVFHIVLNVRMVLIIAGRSVVFANVVFFDPGQGPDHFFHPILHF